jgi:hypothetical protein
MKLFTGVWLLEDDSSPPEPEGDIHRESFSGKGTFQSVNHELTPTGKLSNFACFEGNIHESEFPISAFRYAGTYDGNGFTHNVIDV